MKNSGSLPGALSGQQVGAANVEAGKASALYGKKKPAAKTQKQTSSEVIIEKETESQVVTPSEEVASIAKAQESTKADWEDDDEDDWDTTTNDNKISAFSEQRAARLAEEVEDTLELENKEKFEKLRVLGIERAKRDEETRLRRYVRIRCTRNNYGWSSMLTLSSILIY